MLKQLVAVAESSPPVGTVIDDLQSLVNSILSETSEKNILVRTPPQKVTFFAEAETKAKLDLGRQHRLSVVASSDVFEALVKFLMIVEVPEVACLLAKIDPSSIVVTRWRRLAIVV